MKLIAMSRVRFLCVLMTALLALMVVPAAWADATADLRKATAQLALRQFEQAIVTLTAVIKESSDNAAAYKFRGAAYLSTGQMNKGIEDLSKAASLDPSDARVFFYRAMAYAGKQEIDKSLDDFAQAIRLNPNDAESYAMRGRLNLAIQRNEEAVADFTQVLRLQPNNRDAGTQLQVAQNRLKAPQKPSEVESAVDANEIGLVLMQKGKTQEAIAYFDRSVELKPDRAVTYMNRGSAYDNLGQIDKAMADFNKTLEMDPNLAPGYFNRGLAYARQQKWNEAIDDCTEDINLRPDHQPAYVIRASCYREVGKLDLARKDAEEALRLKPSDMSARQLIAALNSESAKSSAPNTVQPTAKKVSWLVIDKNGKTVMEPNSGIQFCEGLASDYEKSGGHCFYMDRTGKKILEPSFNGMRATTCGCFSQGLAAVSFSSADGKRKTGYIDRTGKMVIEPKFAGGGQFAEDLAPVNIDGKFGYIDKTGEIKIKPQFERADKFDHGLAFTENGKGGSIYVQQDGTVVNAITRGKRAWIDHSGNEVPRDKAVEILKQAKEGYSEGLKAAKQSEVPNFYGYIDESGKLVIPYQFQDAKPFSDGLAAVQIQSQWGYIDKSGKWVVKPKYLKVTEFSDGLASVLPGTDEDLTGPASTLTKLMQATLDDYDIAKETFK